jgi:hypothetical protein
VAADKKGRINLDTLAALRSRLYLTVSDYTMAKAKVEEASKSAYYHEDLMAALSREDGVRRIKWSFQDEGTEREYAWEVSATLLSPLFLRPLNRLMPCLSPLS